MLTWEYEASQMLKPISRPSILSLWLYIESVWGKMGNRSVQLHFQNNVNQPLWTYLKCIKKTLTHLYHRILQWTFWWGISLWVLWRERESFNSIWSTIGSFMYPNPSKQSLCSQEGLLRKQTLKRWNWEWKCLPDFPTFSAPNNKIFASALCWFPSIVLLLLRVRWFTWTTIWKLDSSLFVNNQTLERGEEGTAHIY